MSSPFHPNAIRHNIRMTTPERDSGATAVWALGCLAVVIVLLVGICFA